MKWNNEYYFGLAFIIALLGSVLVWLYPSASIVSNTCWILAFLSFMTWATR